MSIDVERMVCSNSLPFNHLITVIIRISEIPTVSANFPDFDLRFKNEMTYRTLKNTFLEKKIQVTAFFFSYSGLKRGDDVVRVMKCEDKT